MAPKPGAPSSTRTGRPRCASASAVVSPPSPPPMTRMGSLFDIALSSLLRHPDPLDLPLELDTGSLPHARPHRLAQSLDVGSGGAAQIDQKVAVHFRHLGVADLEPAAAGGIDDLPGLVAGRVLEGRAAGAALDRLGGLARLRDLVHLGGDLRRIAGLVLEHCRGEDDVVRHAAMAIAVMHVAVGEDAHAALAVDAARLDQRVLGLAAVGAAVHPQRAADGARNAAEESEPGDGGLLRGAAHLDVGHAGAGADARAGLDLHLA